MRNTVGGASGRDAYTFRFSCWRRRRGDGGWGWNCKGEHGHGGEYCWRARNFGWRVHSGPIGGRLDRGTSADSSPAFFPHRRRASTTSTTTTTTTTTRTLPLHQINVGVGMDTGRGCHGLLRASPLPMMPSPSHAHTRAPTNAPDRAAPHWLRCADQAAARVHWDAHTTRAALSPR